MICAKSLGIIVGGHGGWGREEKIARIAKIGNRRNLENVMMEDRYSSEQGCLRVSEGRYSYYRRCQVFRRDGEQCKAPAEKGAHICHAHAGQLATAVRRERERRAVLAEAEAEMRRRGKPECEMADLFTDFKGIQVTLAVMAQALIDGRIDCKTAGQMVVHLQTMSKLLWIYHRGMRKEKALTTKDTKEHEGRKTLPLINTHDTDRKKLPKPNPLPRIYTDWKKPSVGKSLAVTFSTAYPPALAPACGGARILQFEVTASGDRSRAHGPPESKAA
jgi:hypothetical protein